MDTVQSVYFCFGAKAANSKFATKTVPYNKQACLLEPYREILALGRGSMDLGPNNPQYGPSARSGSG